MKKFLSVLLVICIAFSIVGCSINDTAENQEKNPAESENSTENPIEAAKEEGNGKYPLTIETYNYKKENIEVTFEEKPKRVVTVYQNCIETLLALGVEDVIVGAAGLDHDVKDEIITPKIILELFGVKSKIITDDETGIKSVMFTL